MVAGPPWGTETIDGTHEDPGHGPLAVPHRARHLGDGRLDVGRDRRGALDPHHLCGARARHHADRYGARLWPGPLRGDRRQGGGALGTARPRRAGHQGGARVAERRGGAERDARAHPAGDRRLPEAPPHRLRRSLPGPLARSAGADRGDGGDAPRALPRGPHPRDRRQQLLPGADGPVPPGRAAPRRSSARPRSGSSPTACGTGSQR